MLSTFCCRCAIGYLATAIFFSASSVGNCDEPTITVVGNAESRVVPDQVVITAGIESRAQTVAAASKDNDAKVHSVLEFLEKSGIEKKHIRTDYISIEPIMQYGAQYSEKGHAQRNNAQAAPNSEPFGSSLEQESERPVGYMASRQFAITIADLKKFEAVYKGLIELGINRVRGIEFRTSELKQHQDKVRLDAVRAARDKAQAMSGELGATLASIKTIRDTGSADVLAGPMARSSAADPFGGPSNDAPTFAAGQIAITASVEIVFILGDTKLKK